MGRLLLGLWCVTLIGAEKNVLWHEPGPPESYDFVHGPGGVEMEPKPPFTFDSEDLSGTKLKVWVIDAARRKWNVKFAHEARPESFSYKLAWACGYWVEPMYLVKSGVIDHMGKMKRSHPTLHKDGAFTFGRFEYRDPRYEFLKDRNWSWSFNPFIGTPEMNGLEIVLMVLGNWDNKDARDVGKGINTAIFLDKQTGEYDYAFIDWGQTLGRWGNPITRSGWNCSNFREQNLDFVRGVKGDEVEWGFAGRHPDFKRNIHVSDVQWIMRYLGRITDDQMRDGLLASGATDEEASCFTSALRDRIEQLRRIQSTAPSPLTPTFR